MEDKKWSMDEFGYVSNAGIIFHISDLKSVSKNGDVVLNLVIHIGMHSETFTNTEDRDKGFQWFSEILRAHARVCKEHEEFHHNYMEAQLATQKRILGDNINEVK